LQAGGFVLRLTKKSKYAVRALVELALNEGGTPLGVAEIARRQYIPERFLEQIFGEQVYMHQFKINGKMAFEGDVWQWHQDYGTWQRDDDMPEARAMNIALFLDDVTEFNGPLMFIPKSHKRGVLEAGHDVTTTLLPAVDAGSRHDPGTGRGRRSGRAQGPDRLGPHVPRQSGARLAEQPVAVGSDDRLHQRVSRR
jgi:hypothetical protein